MKCKDVVELVAVLLQMQSLIDSGVFRSDWLAEGTVEDAVIEKPELALIVECVNLICKEIASDYVPLRCVERLKTLGGKLEYSALNKELLEIRSVKSVDGSKQNYKCYSKYIAVDCPEVDIEYYYMPSDCNLNGELEFSNSKITKRLVAYGAAAEYCLIVGLGQDALVWEKRYKDSLILACRKRKEMVMPCPK